MRIPLTINFPHFQPEIYKTWLHRIEFTSNFVRKPIKLVKTALSHSVHLTHAKHSADGFKPFCRITDCLIFKTNGRIISIKGKSPSFLFVEFISTTTLINISVLYYIKNEVKVLKGQIRPDKSENNIRINLL
jgi:hypothetical protein